MLTRRSILTGAGALLITSPAIVRAASIMPIQPLLCHLEGGYYPGRYAHFYDGYGDGSFFKESVDFETHTTEVEFQVSGLSLHKGVVDLQSGEHLLQRFNQIMADPRLKRRLVALKQMGWS